ncbi:MAG: hypothetical protein P1U88_12470 [Thalassobaculaceae bacterium]|nr:hypothetical protein [Thalassobaculaceae bacterium]
MPNTQSLFRVAAAAALMLTLPFAAQAAAPAAGDGTGGVESRAAQTLEQQVDRAVSHYTAGEFAAAEQILADVMRSDAASDRLRSLAAFNRGAALLQLDRYMEAVEAFDIAEEEAFPYPAQLHLARGIAWEQLGRADKAAHDYSSALVADPMNPAVQRRIDAFFYKK